MELGKKKSKGEEEVLGSLDNGQGQVNQCGMTTTHCFRWVSEQIPPFELVQ